MPVYGKQSRRPKLAALQQAKAKARAAAKRKPARKGQAPPQPKPAGRNSNAQSRGSRSRQRTRRGAPARVPAGLGQILSALDWSLLGGQSAYMNHVKMISKGFPCPGFSRVEVLRLQGRFILPNKCGAFTMLLHPSGSISPLLGIGNHSSVNTTALDAYSRPVDVESAVSEWVNNDFIDPATGTHYPLLAANGAASQWVRGCYIAEPRTLISTQVRPLGAAMKLVIQCGPGTQGYLTAYLPTVSELAMAVGDLRTRIAGSPYTRKLPLKAGTNTYFFAAPLLDKSRLHHFHHLNDRYTWGIDDAFGGVMVTIHDHEFSENMGVSSRAQIEVVSPLQIHLDLEDRHLSTKHQVHSVDASHNHHTSIHNTGGVL